MNKQFITQLLIQGVQPQTILRKYFLTGANIDDTSDEVDFFKEKPVTWNDIYSLAKIHCNEGLEEDEVGNCLKLMSKSIFVGFNFKKVAPLRQIPPEISEKLHETPNDEVMIAVMSPSMRKRFREHPYLLGIDGTHSSNRSKYITVTLVAYDCRDEASPVFQCLIESENSAVLEVAFSILKKLEPEACDQVRVIITDCAKAFINAWRKSCGSNAKHITCAWHLHRAWAKTIGKSKVELGTDEAEDKSDSESGNDAPTEINRSATVQNQENEELAANGSMYKDWCELRLIADVEAHKLFFEKLKRK